MHIQKSTTESTVQQRMIQCPRCKQDSVYAASNPYRPFCSQRCKLIDLGAWANEEYVITQQSDANEGDENTKA